MGQGLSLAIAVGVPLAGGQLMGLASIKDILGWYKTLNKPKWTPPNYIFGPAWGLLYAAQGVASWVVYTQGKKPVLPLTLYAIQLAFNLAWQPIFFNAKKLDLAFADSVVMVGMATAATVAMAKSAPPELVLPLMVPYVAWISFASVLTLDIWRKNPQESAVIKPKEAKAKAKEAVEEGSKQTKKAAQSAKKQANKAADSSSAEGAGDAKQLANQAADNVTQAADDVASRVKTA